MPKVISSVITTSNQEHHLSTTVESIVAQTSQKAKVLAVCLLTLAASLLPSIAASRPPIQSIQTDGSTGTTVNRNGNRFNITGGQQSGDGTNLFHSFSEFGLDKNQTANFISDPSILNILGRVTGGNPSVINGHIQVTGGNSNLFLINPAGIIFGSKARLNVPADFTATTATGIGFGNDSWFNAAGANDYSTLVGKPSAFAFGLSGTPGAIVNDGRLRVKDGHNLTLLGGTVVSTDQLTAPGGNITVAAVPGQNLVRISQAGHLLSLEIQPSPTPTANPSLPPPLSLPALLTGGAGSQVEGLTVNPNGQVVLNNRSGVIVPDSAGTVVVSGTADASTTTPSQNGGSVRLLGEQVGFFGDITARGSAGGSGGFVEVSGNENLTFGGAVDTSALNGDRGTLLLRSANLSITDGAIAGAPNPQPTSPFNANIAPNTLSWGQIADLERKNNSVLEATGLIAIADVLGNTPGVTQNDLVNLGSNTGSLTIRSTGSSITFLDTNDTIQTQGSAIALEAFNGITAGNFLTNGGALSLNAENGSIATGQINSSSASGNGAAVTLNAQNGSIATGQINSSSASGNGGALTLNAQNGSIATGQINSSSAAGNGAAVTLNAQNSITIDSIDTRSLGNGIGGNVDITTGEFFRASGTNSINASISTDGEVDGGSITIQHGGGILGVPFSVDSDYNGVNGTAGAISTGRRNQIRTGVFLGPDTQGNPPSDIQIITPGTDTNPVLPQLLVDNPQQESQQDSAGMDSAPLPTLARVEIDTVLAPLDESFTRQFQQYFGRAVETSSINFTQASATLQQIEKATGIKPALIYAVFVPATISSQATPEGQAPRPTDQLELLLVTAQGKPIRKRVEGATRQKVLKIAQEFLSSVTNVRSSRGYLSSSQQLYKWLVAPLAVDLQAQKINNLVFLMDSGLRSIPLAALHDGQEFLVERYSVGLMPSLNLTDTRYQDIKYSQVLAMGAENFSDQKSLPAVPLELSLITNKLWKGKSFLNDAFTLENLKAQRQRGRFGIIHLATHAEFQPGSPDNSYIQLSNSKLRLSQLPQLGWNKPPVEMLVLSACRTAVGDEQAELGFAGLAVQAGVKSAVASLWSVSDEATLGLMAQFYEQLKSSPTKAESLRQAQLAMLKGQVRIESGRLHTPLRDVPLPPVLALLGDQQLTHPYYWAAFTMIGNPW